MYYASRDLWIYLDLNPRKSNNLGFLSVNAF